MLQAALLDRPFFDLLSFSENGVVAPEVDVGECDVAQALSIIIYSSLSGALSVDHVPSRGGGGGVSHVRL